MYILFNAVEDPSLDDIHKVLQERKEKKEKIKMEKRENEEKKAPADKIVNHPDHYNRENALQCIDEMILIFGKEAVKNFCLCNAWKYRYRAMSKNGEEDLKKSDWYIRKYKELKATDGCHDCTCSSSKKNPYQE